MTKPQNEKPGFIHVSDSKIIGNTGYIEAYSGVFK